MESIPAALLGDAARSLERLGTFARRAAAGNTGPDASGSSSAMARVAREAIFADALTSAIRAHLQECKTAAK